MIRFLFRLMFWVTVGRWVYAEAALVTPRAVPYINSLLRMTEIPTHNHWAGSTVGQFVSKSLPQFDDLKHQVSANVELPIKYSAGVLQQASFELHRAGSPNNFERF